MITKTNMVEGANHRNWSNWWLPIFAAIGALILGASILLSNAFDLLEIAYIFVGVPIVSILLAIFMFLVARRTRRAPSTVVFLMLPAYWAVTWILFANGFDVRTTTRWMLEAKQYKAGLLKQPESSNGDLKHMEWDSWGWAGMDTDVYLVFDPADSLAVPARKRSSGRFRGIPCAVPRIRRLESHWYAVEYYTDASWNECS